MHEITIQTKASSSEFNLQEAKEQIKCLVLVTWNSKGFCGRGKEKGCLFSNFSLGSGEEGNESVFLLAPILFSQFSLFSILFSITLRWFVNFYVLTTISL